jgi:outer membrane protein OmpA-like peptidoglycan-associated protein
MEGKMQKFQIFFMWATFLILGLLIIPDSYCQELAPTSKEINDRLSGGQSGDALVTMGPQSEPRKGPKPYDMEIPFELNQYSITARAVPYLKALGEALSQDNLKGYIFEVQGHTCNLGSAQYNKELSLKRSRTIVDYLTKYFPLSPSQFKTVGYGAEKPKDVNTTEEGRRHNRRVTIINTTEPFTTTSSRPFVNVEVKYRRGQNWSDLNPMDVLTARDDYYIAFTPKQDCYVYVIQVDSRGAYTMLFPAQNFTSKSNPVLAGTYYRIPENLSDNIYLNENIGEEAIYIIAQTEQIKEPLKLCERLIKGEESNSQLAETSNIKSVETMGPKGTRPTYPYLSEGNKNQPIAANLSQTNDVDLKNLFTWELRFNHQ